MNNAITRRAVSDRAGNRLELPPMAEYLSEPSQRAYVRARDYQAKQRIDRDRREAMALLRVLEPEPKPQRPAAMPDHHTDPAPVFNAEFIAGLLAGLAFSGIVAGALILGNRL